MPHKYRILLLEDVISDVELIKRELQKAEINFSLKHVIKKKDFQKELKNFHPDIILSDYLLPQFDGMAALKIVQEQALHIPFILVTGSINEETAVDSIKAGAADYVTKEHLGRLGPAVKGAIEKMKTEIALQHQTEILDAVYYTAHQFLKETRWEKFINEVLERLGNAMNVSRVYIFENHIDSEGVLLTSQRYEWVLPGITPQIDNPAFQNFPRPPSGEDRWGDTLRKGEIITGHVKDFPPREQKILMSQNIISIIVVPIFVGKDWWGFLGFDECKTERLWSDEETETLKTAADTIGLAIQRNRAKEALKESEEKYRGVVENIIEIIYIVTIDEDPLKGNVEFVGGQTEQIIGYQPEEFIQDSGLWLSIIHPDDIVDVSKSTKKIITHKKMSIRVYRIRHKHTREYRWIEDKVVPTMDDDGKVVGYFGVARDVTERIHAEEELREAQAYSQNLINSSLDMIIAVDKNRKIVEFNRAAEDTFGYTKGEILGQNIDILYDDPSQGLKIHTESREKGKFVGEITNIRKNGNIFPVLLSASILRNDEGEFMGVMGVSRDISEQKQAEEELTQLKVFNEDIIRSMAEGIVILNNDGIMIYINPAAENMLGYKQGELTDQHWAMIIPESQQHVVIAADKRRMKGKADSYELKLLRKDKKRIHVLVSGSPRYEDNQIIGTMAVFTDITERKKAEEAQQRLFIAVEQAAESIIITNTVGNIQYINPAFERTTGYSQKEVIGKNPWTSNGGVQDKEFYKQLWDVITQGNVWTGHFINKKKDGTSFEEEVTISPVRDAHGKIVNYVSVGRDITQELALEEQLRQAHKLEAIGRLAGGIAHDFNNILTGIMGYADLALTNLSENHPLRESFITILNKSDEAARLIRQLLAFSRRQILDIHESDINHIIRQSAQFLRHVLRDDIKLTMKISKSPCIFNADSTAIQQIITNLCVNAQDAMPRGGKIVITTSNVSLDEEFCRSTPIIKPGKYVKLTISDTGTGIDKHIRDQIFEPFFTTKEVGKGTGLGLSMVYGLVKQHNGTIECNTEQEKGTTFVLYFPQSSEKALRIKKAKSVTPLSGKETVLIIEDDLDVLNVLKNILDNSGYSTLIAKDGLEGHNLLLNKENEIDLVITDIFMPEMSGIELYNKTSHFRNHIKFLFITGHAPEEGKDILKQGMELLTKPFTSIQLTKVIRKLLDNE